jgi:DNA-binding CsgD family transcriptional regulator
MNLSPREKMLLRCIALNWDSSKTADEMRISKGTVASMKHNIRRKLPKECRNHGGLYKWAQEHVEELKV